ncbi:midas domain-containing protein [Weissella ceti]|uniref:hypothetical protein n=1 Tax=Weissella ceti TaxID=759620 RepID=UPI001BCF13EE|nr:hypothetical protein [Weissella ceti]QVK12619.1 hypothetical protein KHQ31_03070 [Weissella ceti]
MKNKYFKRSILLVLSAFLIALIFNMVIGSANESNKLISAVETGDMDFVLDKIANFRLYHMSLGMTDIALVPAFALSDMIWGLDTVLYTVCDKLLDVLFNPVAMNDTILWVTNISQSLFTGLSGTIFLTAFTLSALIAILYFFTKGRTASIKQLILTILLVAGSVVWFIFAPVITTTMNTISTEIGATVAKSVSGNLEDNKNAGQIGLVAGNKETSGNASNQVRQSYFNQSYYSLWSLGTIGMSNPTIDMTKEFLKDKPLEDKDVDKLKGDSYKNLKDQQLYFNKFSGPFKFIVSVVGLIIIPLKAAPYILIGLFNWVIAMLIMALIIFLPVLALISFFPKYNKSMITGISKIVTYFVAKGLVVLSIVVVLISEVIVSKMLGTGLTVGFAGLAGLIVGTILQFVLLYLVWQNKNKILSVITGGLVTNVPFVDRSISDLNRRMGNVIDGLDEKHVDDPYKKGDGTKPNYYDLKKLEAMDSQDDIQDKDIENYERLDDEPDNGDEEEIDTSDNDEDIDVPEDEDIDSHDDEDIDVPEDEEVDFPDDEDIDVPEDEEIDFLDDEDIDIPEDEETDFPDDEDIEDLETNEDMEFTQENTNFEHENVDMPNNVDESPNLTLEQVDVEQPVHNSDYTNIDNDVSNVSDTQISSDVEYDSSNIDNTQSHKIDSIEQSDVENTTHTNDEVNHV